MVDRFENRVSPSVAPVAAPRVSNVTTLAAGAQRLGRAGQALAAQALETRQHRDDTIAFAQATSRYETGLRAIEREEQANAGVGGSGYLESVQARRDELQQRVLEGLPDYISADVRTQITQSFILADANSRERAAIWADDQNRSWRLDGLQEVFNSRYAEIEADPSTAEAVRADVLALVAEAGVAPDERRAIERAVTLDVAAASVAGHLAGGDVDAALAVLDEYAGDLSPAEQRALDKVIDDWIEDQTDAIDPADHHDRMVSGLLYGSQERDLDMADAYLREYRDEMDADDYGQHVKALRALREGGGGAGPEVRVGVRQLVRDVEMGRYTREELDTVVRDGLADHLLDAQAIDQIEGAWDALTDANHRAGRELIEAAFRQNELSDTFSNAREVAREDALEAFETWLRENPDATRAQLRAEARAITAVYNREYLGSLEPIGEYGRPMTLEEVGNIRERMATDIASGALNLSVVLELQELLAIYEDALRTTEAESQAIAEERAGAQP